MDVIESEWIETATENIRRYLNRGGDGQGDEPQVLGGTELLNTIGAAMGFDVRDPRDWTDAELQRALNHDLVFYEGDARRAIDIIAEQIRYRCGGDSWNYITVLPIELYVEGKLHELPLFRVHRKENSPRFYIDNIGRYYSNVYGWYISSKLPPGKMAYPKDLKLQSIPGTDRPRVSVDTTPAARVSTEVIEGVDLAASLVGIGTSVALCFATGGIAAPLSSIGVVSAIWGTARTGHNLVDRAVHGESVNPFNSSESRMMWLGVAANLISFGAMGASMRLTSLAARGTKISASFKLLVNVMNGSSLVVGGVAMIDTTIFLTKHYKELTFKDCLFHAVSIAFWTKGVFSYKTAGTLIKDVQKQVLEVIGKELNPEVGKKISSIRTQLNDDGQLVRGYHKASEAGISVQKFSEILIDIKGNFQFDNSGNIVLTGGQTYSVEFLGSLPQNVRSHYFDVITNLNVDQVELLESFRGTVNNDLNLIAYINQVAAHYDLSPREATRLVLHFWSQYTQTNMAAGADIVIRDGSIVLGRAPPLPLTQLRGISSSMVRFMGEHLVRMDEATSRQWTTSIPVLLHLETHGMFSHCRVTRIIPNGRAVVLLNENLQISIFKLREIDDNDCQSILRSVGQLSPTATSADVPKETRKLMNRYRLRLECDRREGARWMRANASAALLAIIDAELQNFELDRFITFRGTVETSKATPYMREMMDFVVEMQPRNVSELVAYGEYAVTCVEAERRALEVQLRRGELQVPAHTRRADFLRQRASERVFADRSAMCRQWEATAAVVRENSMVGVASVAPGLAAEALVAAVRGVRVGFGSETSATYHAIKHPTDPLGAYVDRANECVRDATRWQASLVQDGDARTIRFESNRGAAILLERNGRVLLATFSPNTAGQ